MLFNSLIFLYFLVIVFCIYWIIPSKYRNLSLLLASYYFYYSFNPWFLLLLIGTSVIDYYLAQKISSTKEVKLKKTLLILSLISNLGVLVAFKYTAFLYNSISVLFQNEHVLSNFIIPVGLSFYTFQSISYTIDVYRNKYKANDSLKDFLLYVSFFPHMIAGPIVRHHQLMPQLKAERFFKRIDWNSASKLLIWGFFKKMVIADNIALIVDPIFNSQTLNFSGFEYFIAALLFLIQLYSDFSGYSDIAMGVAKLFNINLILNWNRPLLSSSITDYWKRHHISLTNWFKDYLYISLGGNKVSKTRWILNILIVFVMSGFWHGANYTFIIWGILNALFYLLEHPFQKMTFKIPFILKWAYTITFISIFFIAFRANSVTDIFHIYNSIIRDFRMSDGLIQFMSIKDKIYYPIIFSTIIILFLKEIQEEWQIIKSGWFKNQIAMPLFYIIILALIFSIGNFNANTFIYFQF